MPSGTKKRRSTRRKKLAEALETKSTTKSQDDIISESSNDVAHEGKSSIVPNVPIVILPEPEVKTAKEVVCVDDKVPHEELECSQNETDQVKMLPSSVEETVDSAIQPTENNSLEVVEGTVFLNDLSDHLVLKDALDVKEENLVFPGDNVGVDTQSEGERSLNFNESVEAIVKNQNDTYMRAEDLFEGLSESIDVEAAEITHGAFQKENEENILPANDDELLNLPLVNSALVNREKENQISESGVQSLSKMLHDAPKDDKPLMKFSNIGKGTGASHSPELTSPASSSKHNDQLYAECHLQCKSGSISVGDFADDGQILRSTEQFYHVKKMLEEELLATEKLREFLKKALVDLDACLSA